ncbi:hypothetical protein F5Y13DRAFT_174895 [Hypoxylon sp. FL1857]|nr:hypothetical protein F5Y13DRAFT_174895 [Hypoxylon sp. FL1857]
MNHPQQPLGGQIIDLQAAPTNRNLVVKHRRNGKLQYAFYSPPCQPKLTPEALRDQAGFSSTPGT